MEEFRSSPVPTLRVYEPSYFDQHNSDMTNIPQLKPPCIRRSTDPTPASSMGWSSTNLAHRPRNNKPSYARGHVRSHSLTPTSQAPPPMSRAKSLPGVHGVGYFSLGSPIRPSSPVGSPSRNRALKKPVDEVFPGFPLRTAKPEPADNPVAILEEDEEPSSAQERSSSPSFFLGNTLPRAHRPSSPLRGLATHQTGNGLVTPTSPSSMASSPLYSSTRFDSFGGYHYATSASSVPTTPSSLRSRSPSISSLETIPDTPDAEEAALEAERIAQLKAAADAADGDEAAEAIRQSMDASVSRGRKLGAAFGSRDKSKRWSVCGAERRGDLDLETIWED